MDRYTVKRPAISAWIEAGLPHERIGPGTRGELRFDLEEVAAWVKTTGRAARRGRGKKAGLTGQQNATLTTIEIEHAEAKLRKDLAAAEKAEMELDRLHDRLLDADEVKQGHLDRIARAKAVLLGAPASLSPDLVGLEQIEIEARLSDWICLALAELASEGNDE